MAWIQIDTDLESKPEYIKLLGLTKVSRAELTRRIFQLWCWIDTATEDGFFIGLDENDLSNQFEGTAPEFWKCFEHEAVKWLEFASDGITVPGYEKRFSQSAKKRANDAKRAAIKRNSQGGENDESHEKRQKSHSMRRNADLEKRREEESKEEQKEGTPDGGSLSGGGSEKKFVPDKVDLPFPSEAFASAWAEWCIHRVEIKRKLTPKAVEKQLKAFAKMGEARAIAAIDNTIQNGWIGIREPEQPRAGPKQKSSPPDPTQRKLPAMR